MIYQSFLVITALLLLFSQLIHADWDGNPEGATDSGIRTVDIDGGFNVTDSGGRQTMTREPLVDPSHFHFT